MVEEVGWDSDKPGYDGLIEVANRLMLKNPTNSDTKEAAVHCSTLLVSIILKCHVNIILIINNKDGVVNLVLTFHPNSNLLSKLILRNVCLALRRG